MTETHISPIYWELRNGQNGEITLCGYANSINEAVSFISDTYSKIPIVIPPGLYVDGSPNMIRTRIKTDELME
jgi:hypothetical protein